MLSKVRLELARTVAFPEGSHQIGYEFTVPLDGQGVIDADSWKTLRDKCRVRRFRPDEDDDVGHVLHRPGGSWAFHYDIRTDDSEPDEAGYRFGAHVFKPGEYVSIQENGDMVTYRVVKVMPASTGG